MATAAQLAKRKLAAPKSRLNRTPGASSPAMESPNPFANGGFSQQQPFQSPSTDNFGTNQSFPPTNGASNSGFKFSVPGSSNSFTFGQSFATPANNPFSDRMNVNSEPDVTPSNGVNSEDTMMESPQKKPVFGGFGSSNNTSNFGGSNIFAAFGGQSNQAPQQPNFGASQSQVNGFGASSGNSIFGQPLNSQPASSSAAPAFGQSAQNQAQNTPFGQTGSVFSQPAATAASTASQPLFSFGQNASPAATQSPSFSFAPSPALASPQPSTTSFSFSQSSQPAAVSDTKAEKPANEANRPSFGSAAPGSSAPLSASIFSPVQQNSTPGNPFASFGSKHSATAKSDAALFQPPAAMPSNPFASLTGSTPKQSTDTASSTIPSDTATTTQKPLFGFAAPSQPSGLFSAKPETPGNAKSAQSTAQSTASSDTPFKVSAPSSQTSSSDTTSNTKSSSSLFGNSVLSSESAPGAAERRVLGNDDKPSKLFSFGSNSTPKPVTQTSNLFNGFGTTSPSVTGTAETAPNFPPTNNSDNSSGSKPISNASAKSLFSTPFPNAESTVSASSSTSTSTTHSEKPAQGAPKRTVYSNPPTRIPAWLDGDKYKSYDSNYRLHSLNREFQKRIASLDPATNDFENILRSYVAARESIGESIGLYTRNIAGMKRKVDESGERSEDSQSTKRARQTEESRPSPQSINNPPVSSVFQPVPSTSSATNSNGFASAGKPASIPKPATSAPSAFKSMLPGGQSSFAQSSEAQPANSLFSGLNSSNGASSSRLTASATGSTTPPSSPPKTDQPSATGFQPVTTGFKPSNTGFKPAATGFKPTAPASSAGIDFMSAFSRSAQASSDKFAKEAREKRKAEEYDSDEDDLDAWTKKYEEEEKAKRAKITTASTQGFKPVFAPVTSSTSNKPAADNKSSGSSELAGASGLSAISKDTAHTVDQENDAGDEHETGSENDDGDQSENDEQELQEDEVENEEDENAEEDEGDEEDTIQLPPGKSLFDRITHGASPVKETKPPSPKKTSTPQFSFGGPSSSTTTKPAKSTPEAPSFSPITPATGTGFVPSKVFNFTPTPKNQSSPTPGASLFSGGLVRDGPIPGEGLFGSRSSTPVNDEKTTSTPFAGFGTSTSTPAADHTWKKGSEIKFGTSTTDAPAVNITAATPPSVKPFGSLFGANAATSSGSAAPNTLGFSFGNTTTSPAPGFLGASSHLLPGSGISSAMSSRATSPGATDNESVTTDTEDAANDPQASFTHTRPGEEDEQIIFECRAKAMKAYTAEEVQGTKKQTPWNTEGTGEMRLLKHKDTGKTRIVLRTDPGANIVVNTNLLPTVKYAGRAIGTNGGVQFPWFRETGKPEKWLIKVKTPAIATELATIMEANKSS